MSDFGRYETALIKNIKSYCNILNRKPSLHKSSNAVTAKSKSSSNKLSLHKLNRAISEKLKSNSNNPSLHKLSRAINEKLKSSSNKLTLHKLSRAITAKNKTSSDKLISDLLKHSSKKSTPKKSSSKKSSPKKSTPKKSSSKKSSSKKSSSKSVSSILSLLSLEKSSPKKSSSKKSSPKKSSSKKSSPKKSSPKSLPDIETTNLDSVIDNNSIVDNFTDKLSNTLNNKTEKIESLLELSSPTTLTPDKLNSKKSSSKKASPKKSSSKKASPKPKTRKKTEKAKKNCNKVEGKNKCERSDGPMHKDCYENENNRCTYKKPNKTCKRTDKGNCLQHDGEMDENCKISDNNRCVINRDKIPKVNKKREASKVEKANKIKVNEDKFNSKWTKGKQLGKTGKEGTSYEVKDKEGKSYAVKEFNNPKKSKARFLKEVELQKKISDIGLSPRIIDVSDDKPYRIVMDKMEMTLPELIENQGGKLKKEQVDDLIRMHRKLDENKIYHNDSNPLNIMVEKSGKFKFIDFGMAKKFTSSTKEYANMISLKALFYGGMQGLINNTNLDKSSFKDRLHKYFVDKKIYTQKEVDKW